MCVYLLFAVVISFSPVHVYYRIQIIISEQLLILLYFILLYISNIFACARNLCFFFIIGKLLFNDSDTDSCTSCTI